jgi:hypothetical protein
MKKITVLIILTVLFSFIAGSMVKAQTGQLPLFMRHILIDYQNNENNTVTLDYKLVVENSGGISASDITLTLVPLFITAPEEIKLKIGDLPVGAQSETILHINTPIVLPEEDVLKQPLLWIVRYRDDEGNEHDVPVESHLDLFLSKGGER